MDEHEIELEAYMKSEEITKIFFVFDNIIEGEELEGQIALDLFKRIQMESLQ
ncbi:MAG: hypothetical protein R6U17_05485 [Thermoplasmata archaeon]